MYSEGEAEAVCNRLKQQGLVDGCITEDGDAFLCGARTLIKNLSCDKQQHLNHITVYHMDDIERDLGLSTPCGLWHSVWL